MKKFALTYLFVVLATTLLLALLKLAGSPATTWGWVAFPILGSLVMWLLFIGAVTTVGLIWPTPKTWEGYGQGPSSTIEFPPNAQFFAPIREEKYRVERLKVQRDVVQEHPDSYLKGEQRNAYYRKALALELATLAHDTPGLIEWGKRGETLIGELKILVKNEHA